MSVALIVLVAILVVLLVILFAAVKVAREYERGVIFRLGRLLPQPKGPGLFLLIPVVDRMVKVDLRTVTLNVPPQEVITKDNVPVRVNAVAYFRIVEPKAAIVQVENYMVATSQIAQTTLRSVLGQHLLDELLSERDKINAILQQIIDEATAPWGIKVSIVEVKDVEIPAGMQRAMARQAEAERERRAKVIAGTGSNSTAVTIQRSKGARELGVDGVLTVAPYYNKPTQEGLYAHFRAIAEAVDGLPVVIYNVPGRTSSNISAETTLRLARDDHASHTERFRIQTMLPRDFGHVQGVARRTQECGRATGANHFQPRQRRQAAGRHDHATAGRRGIIGAPKAHERAERKCQ